MNLPKEDEMVSILKDQLKGYQPFEGEVSDLESSEFEHGDYHPDAVLQTDDKKIVVEMKKSATPSNVNSFSDRLKELKQDLDGSIFPLLVVPYMMPKSAEILEEKGISWVDLSGNAHISEGELYVHVEGKENQFKTRGRPSNLFAPASSRIAKFFLIHQKDESFRHKEIVSGTNLAKSHVSRLLNRLVEENYLVEKTVENHKEYSVNDPDILLDAWSEKYDFLGHDIRRGVIPTRDSAELMKRVSKSIGKNVSRFVFTGLAGASQLGEKLSVDFTFRTVTIYVNEFLSESRLENIGFQEGQKGANIWFVRPSDNGVFMGAEEKGVPMGIAHPVQLYLDLMNGHPERAKTVGEEIRKDLLNWS